MEMEIEMKIGLPTNVRHVAHVTFDKFDGFLGLPIEFEPEVLRKPPSASASVFGVSTDSMQLSFDSRGNCVPTILLMMQKRLYALGGLQVHPEQSPSFLNSDWYSLEFDTPVLILDRVGRRDLQTHSLGQKIIVWFMECMAARYPKARLSYIT